MVFTWKAISASVRGDAHERNGTKNQDAVRIGHGLPPAEALVLAVSDGHGSTRSFRSDRGSALAAECVVSVTRQFVRRHGPDAAVSSIRRDAKNRWLRHLIHEWRRRVRADIEANPFSPLDFAAFPDAPPVAKPGEELSPLAYLAYGATLIFVVVTRRYIVYAQIGDGDILTISPDGQVTRPLVRHHEFFANQTTSICTAHAFRDFQVRVEPVRANAPALIMLSTDGYANCFGSDQTFFKVGLDILTYLRFHGGAYVASQLQEWLHDSSRDGSGDDITVALAARTRSTGF